MSPAVPGRRMLATLGLAMSVILALTSCSGGDEPSPEPISESTTAPAPAPTTRAPETTRVRMGKVVGRLSKKERRQVRANVPPVVEGWWQAAYLGGDYPRGTFPDAFPGFTRRATQRAEADKPLLTNVQIGKRVDSVTAVRQRIFLDVIGVRGRARGVTARFELRFDTTGEKAGTTTVRGRLVLNRRNGPWKVFGYDISRGERP